MWKKIKFIFMTKLYCVEYEALNESNEIVLNDKLRFTSRKQLSVSKIESLILDALQDYPEVKSVKVFNAIQIII